MDVDPDFQQRRFVDPNRGFMQAQAQQLHSKLRVAPEEFIPTDPAHMIAPPRLDALGSSGVWRGGTEQRMPRTAQELWQYTCTASTAANRAPASFDEAFGDIVGHALSRHQSLTGEPQMGWDDNGPFLNYAFFPTILTTKQFGKCVVPFCALYSSFQPTSGGDGILPHIADWREFKTVGGITRTLNVDVALIGDTNSEYAIVSALNMTQPRQGSYVSIFPAPGDMGFLDAMFPELRRNAVRGASLGLAVAAAVLGMPSIAYTGYVRKLAPDMRDQSGKYKGQEFDPAGYAALTGGVDFPQRQPVTGLQPVFRSSDMVEDVDMLGFKCAWSIVHQFPLIIPYKSDFQMPVVPEFLRSERAQRQSYLLTMAPEAYTMVQAEEGIPFTLAKTPILIAVTLAEATILSAYAWIGFKVSKDVAVQNAMRTINERAYKTYADKTLDTKMHQYHKGIVQRKLQAGAEAGDPAYIQVLEQKYRMAEEEKENKAKERLAERRRKAASTQQKRLDLAHLTVEKGRRDPRKYDEWHAPTLKELVDSGLSKDAAKVKQAELRSKVQQLRAEFKKSKEMINPKKPDSGRKVALKEFRQGRDLYPFTKKYDTNKPRKSKSGNQMVDRAGKPMFLKSTDRRMLRNEPIDDKGTMPMYVAVKRVTKPKNPNPVHGKVRALKAQEIAKKAIEEYMSHLGATRLRSTSPGMAEETRTPPEAALPSPRRAPQSRARTAKEKRGGGFGRPSEPVDNQTLLMEGLSGNLEARHELVRRAALGDRIAQGYVLENNWMTAGN